MAKAESAQNSPIQPEMTILDVISEYRETEAVFKRYDEYAGECLCCRALFDSLQEVCEKYGLNLEKFLADLRDSAKINYPI